MTTRLPEDVVLRQSSDRVSIRDAAATARSDPRWSELRERILERLIWLQTALAMLAAHEGVLNTG